MKRASHNAMNRLGVHDRGDAPSFFMENSGRVSLAWHVKPDYSFVTPVENSYHWPRSMNIIRPVIPSSSHTLLTPST